MATVVQHVETGKKYVVIGAGFAMHKGGELASAMRHAGVCVCDAEGRIGWFSSTELEVVSVFGQTPAEVLAPAPIDEDA